MSISVLAVSAYSICTFAMSHNVCRYDKSFYPEAPSHEIFDDPNQYPNVTTPVELSFIFGLVIHVALFIVDVFMVPYLRFYSRADMKDSDQDKAKMEGQLSRLQ